ncbi:MAG TPA: menaquinone biosynthesis protein [Gemmatimonadaceae bacterium]|nr:menaquinone biosynthesis protein [Gemmatimonadaceae bacterium]
MMRVGRIPYVNCYPVYGAIDRGIVPLAGEIVDGVPSALNRQMATGALDVSVISAVEYARDSQRYLLLPDLAISCDGPVRSVMLFAKRPASELRGRRVLVSRSSMTSVALLELLFDHVWDAKPAFVPADAELTDIARFGVEDHDARLVIGDAALRLGTHLQHADDRDELLDRLGYRYAYDLGAEWKNWTDLPFVFAVWVAQRAIDARAALDVHASLIASRNWGLKHLEPLAAQAALATGVSRSACLGYLSGLDYGLSYGHLAGLTEFFRRLVAAGRVPNGSLSFLAA